MVLIHPQVCINDVSINGEDLEGVYVMLYFESWIVLFVSIYQCLVKTNGTYTSPKPSPHL
jgi:hypothetical protein